MKKKYSYRGVRVSSKVRVGAKNSKRQKSYCARSGAIRGSWKTNKKSPNWVQRRRWKCGYVPGEVRE